MNIYKLQIAIAVLVSCLCLFNSCANDDDEVYIKEVQGVIIDRVVLLSHPEVDINNEHGMHTGANFTVRIPEWPNEYFADQSYDLLQTNGRLFLFPYVFTFSESENIFSRTNFVLNLWAAHWGDSYFQAGSGEMASFRLIAEYVYQNDNRSDFSTTLYNNEQGAEIAVHGRFVLE